jgi:hypothetical protein
MHLFDGEDEESKKTLQFIAYTDAEAEKEKENNRRDINFGVTGQRCRRKVGGVVEKMGYGTDGDQGIK